MKKIYLLALSFTIFSFAFGLPVLIKVDTLVTGFVKETISDMNTLSPEKGSKKKVKKSKNSDIVSKNESVLLTPGVTITATKSVVINGGGNPIPGSQLDYSVLLGVSGADATSVVFIDNLVSDLTLLAGSLKASPIATNDSYNCIGNVGINVAVGNGVLINDVNPIASNTVTVTAFDAASTNGGTISMTLTGGNAGAFTYTPAPGFNGNDTFTYTIDNGSGITNASRTATVTISVSTPIWFVDASYAGGGSNGTLAKPFLSVSAFQAINDGANTNKGENGDYIFVYSGSYSSSAITLRNAQKLIGKDATNSIPSITGINLASYPNTLTLPTTGGASVTIANTTATSVTLGSDNEIAGCTFTSTTGTTMIGASVGALKIRETVLSASAAQALQITAGGALDVQFKSITSTGSTKGISVNNSTGSFQVLGSGTTAGSGGTISNKTLRGAEFNGVSNITLVNMNFTNANTSSLASSATEYSTANGAITLNNVSGVTLTKIAISGITRERGITGKTISNFILNGGSTITDCGDEINEGCLYLQELTGTCTISDATLSKGSENIARIFNSSGNLVLNIGSDLTTTIFNDTQTQNANMTTPGSLSALRSYCFIYNATSNAYATINARNTSFLKAGTHGLKVISDGTANINTVNVKNCTFNNDNATFSPNDQGGSIELTSFGTSIMKYNILNNSCRGKDISLINVVAQLNSSAEGRINGNTVTHSGAGSAGNGINLSAEGNSNITTLVDNNTVSGMGTGVGIFATAIGGTGKMNATITNNTVTITDPLASHNIAVQAGNTGTTFSNTTCANVSNNTTSRADLTNGFNFRTRVVNTGGSHTMYLQGTGATSANDVWNNNINAPTGAVVSQSGTFGTNIYSSTNASPSSLATCATVTNPAYSSSEITQSPNVNDQGLVSANARVAGTPTSEINEPKIEGISNLNAPTQVLNEVKSQNSSVNTSAAVETVTVNGAGSGFNIPAGKSTTVKFSATVSSTPSTCAITNTASVSGSNFSTISSNQTTTNLIVPIINSGSTISESSVCSGGTVTLGATCPSGSQLNWFTVASNGSSVSTNNSFSPTNITSATSYYASCTISGCESSRTLVGSVTINPIPTISVSSSPSICSGVNSFTIPYTGTTTSPTTYSISGTGITTVTNGALGSSPITVNLSSAASGSSYSYLLIVKNANGCVSSSESGSVPVNTSVTPSVAISASPGNVIVPATNVTFTAVPTNGGTPSYQWKKNNGNVGSNLNTYSDAGLANGDIITCVMTSNATCASPAVATSSGITMVVNNCPATPLDQNFEGYSNITYPPSISLDCIEYSTENAATGYVGVGNVNSEGISSGGVLTGNAAVLLATGTSPLPLYGKFASTNSAINFKLVSLSAEFFGHSNGQSAEIYNIIGYDNGVAKATVNNFNVKTSGSYGSGSAAIVYNRADYNANGANTGTLTFGSAWGNIDEVRFVVNDPAPNNYMFVGLDNINFETAEIPVITTIGTTTAFASCSGSVSASQSFTVSGANLEGNVTLSAPTGFEIATSVGGAYSASLSLIQTAGVVPSTSIFVRLKSNATGSPSGNVSCTASGALSKNIAVSGVVNALPDLTKGTSPAICSGLTSFAIPFSATSGTPISYSISGIGITTVTDEVLPASPITVNLSSGATGSSISFILTVKNANGCTSNNISGSVSVNSINLTVAAQTNVSCIGGSNGAASISTTGGSTPYSYNWTPGNPVGDGTASITGLSAGTWTCTVTDANSCTATQTVTITQPPALSVTLASQTNVSCNGGNNGAASMNTPTGGTTPYSYNWTPGNPLGDGTASVTGLTAGTWTCTVTDANSCTVTQTVTITQPPALSVTLASQTNVSCNGGNNGAASVNTPTGGTASYSYNWTPGNPLGDGTASVTGITAGTWTCTVTDANSCTATQTVIITQPPALSVTLASQTNVSCNGGNNGAASMNTPTGGTAPYNYNWTPGNPLGDGTASITGLSAGTWTCTVTDANSCTVTQTVTITQPPALSVTLASQTNVSCNGGNNGGASVTPTGGTAPYSYNWTPGNPLGDGTASVTGLTAGTWTCTVTDANSCTVTQTVTITQPPALSVTLASQTNVSCNGGNNGAASMNTPTGGTAPYNYNWTPGNPVGDGTASITGLTAGTWTCTVTDANSCTVTQTVTITQPPALSVTLGSQTNVSCNGGSNGAASVNTPTGGTAPYNYNWTPGNPLGDGTASVTGLTAGTWTCTVTDANSCTVTQTVTITQPPALSVTLGSQTNVSCNGGSNGAASVNTPTGGTAPYNYNWTPGNPLGDGTASVTGLTAGTWTCTVTDANSCTVTQTVTITQPPALSVTLGSQTNVSCNGGNNGAASVTPTGGTAPYSYNWTPGNPVGDGTASIAGLSAGTWTCTVTDANSCTVTQTVTITQPPALSVTLGSQTNVSCNGGNNGAASVTPTGGTAPYSYNWTPGNPLGDGTASVTGLTAGTWTCTVTDANSCTVTQTVTITQPPALSVTLASQTNVSCNGGSNGAASVNTPTGGTASYSYNWTPGNPLGDGTASVTGLTAGTWTCTVTDANSCTVTQTVTITQPPALSVTLGSQTNVSCNGGNNGAASMNTPTGGTAPYNYNWTPGNPLGDGTASVTGLTAGTWTCTVTDANSCTVTQTVTITQPPALSVTLASQTNVSCNGGNNGAASVTPTGGTAPYSYNWTPGNPVGDGTASVTGLTAGTWTCTVTDANSCTVTQTVTITQPPALSVTLASQTNVSCNGGSNGAASVNTPTGGTAPYSYNWTPGNPLGDGTASVTGLSAGTWTCTVTDANSCTVTQTVTITQPPTLSVTLASQTNVSCNGGSNGAASVNTPTGGTAPYSYNWTPGNPVGDGTASVTGLTAGTWTCTVTDANSCTASQVITITQPSALTVTASLKTDVTCNSLGSASINLPIGGITPYSYNWTPGNPTGDGTTSISGLAAGVWTCTVTDGNGCTKDATVEVLLDNTPPSPSITGADNLNCTITSVKRTVSGLGTYSWSNALGTTSEVNINTPGTYTVTVTGANACTATATTIVTQDIVLPIASISGSENLNCIVTSISRTASGVGEYLWSNGLGTSATVNIVNPGTYTVTVTAVNGCTATATTVVTQDIVSPIPSITGTDKLSCVTTSIIRTVSGGGTYAWSNSLGIDAIANITSSGTYTVTVTTANGCSATATTSVLFDSDVKISFIAQPSSSIICQGNNTSFTAQASEADATYQWQVFRNGNFEDIVASSLYGGVNTNSLILNFPTISITGSQYRCKITLRSCEAISNTGTLTVNSGAEAISVVHISTISGMVNSQAVSYGVALNKNLSTSRVELKAGNSVELRPGFEVEAGGVFLAKIQNACQSTSTSDLNKNNSIPKEIIK